MNSGKLYICSLIMNILPETRAFGIKRALYRWAGAKIEDNVRICSSAMIIGSGNLKIGSNTWVGHKVILAASSCINIGKNVDIAPNVYIGNGTHEITHDRDRIADKEIAKDVIIGEGSWLCVNCCILPGVEIGNKCVVGAGTLVTRSFGNNALICGIPGEKIREL